MVIVATSCGSDSAEPIASPTDASTPQASPTPTALLCRLPIDRGGGALLDIPQTPIGVGVVSSTDDPTSQVKLPDGEPRSGLSYDWAFKRWLPVPFRWVAPDGTRYVYIDSQGRLHLVGVTDGSDAVIQGPGWGVYGFTSGGIYAGVFDVASQPSLHGLWRISPTDGTTRELITYGTWLVVGADAAWSVLQSGPASSVPENSLGFVLNRLDLRTGQLETWYTSSSGRIRVATLDSSARPVLVNVDTAQILIVTSSGAAQSIMAGSLPFELMADSHGIWFTQPMTASIYLVQGSDPQRLGQYGYGGTMQFAGPCH